MSVNNSIRPAEHGDGWNDNRLKAFNISISTLTPGAFFPLPPPSLNDIDPGYFSPLDDVRSPLGDHRAPPSTGISPQATIFLLRLNSATPAGATRTGCVADFARDILRLLDFEQHSFIVSTRRTMPLIVCGKRKPVRTDLCLIHPSSDLILLVLATDNPFTKRADAEARVIAGAVAAFQMNNKARADRDLDPLDTMTIPCITMVNTRPTFYLVPVTAALSEAVTLGQRPATQTEVLRFPTLGWLPQAGIDVGMEDQEYRKQALRDFLAFKELAKSPWAHILQGAV